MTQLNSRHTSAIALGFGLGAVLALAACIGDDPAQGAPVGDANSKDAAATDDKPATGSSSGAVAVSSSGAVVASSSGAVVVSSSGGSGGLGGAGATLPLIDRYSIDKTVWTGGQTNCVNKIDASIKALGGGYSLAAGGSSFARYADRSGAIAVASCIEDTTIVVTRVWAINTAADVSNDEGRLKNLVFDQAPLPISAAVTAFPKIHAAQRILKVPGLALSTCQNRAKAAIDAGSATAPPSPNKWSTLGGNFLAAGGTDGSSGSIICIGDPGGSVVLDVFTIDPAVTTDMLLDTLETAFATG